MGGALCLAMKDHPPKAEERDAAELGRLADWNEEKRAALRELTRAVYPPERVQDSPGRAVEWSSPEWCAAIWRDERLVSFAGLYVREATLDEAPVTVGGVGNVKAHPAERGQGHARRLLDRAAAFSREQGAAFGVLFCEPRLVGYYSSLGWRAFAGTVFVTQRGERVEFTFGGALTRDARGGPREAESSSGREYFAARVAPTPSTHPCRSSSAQPFARIFPRSRRSSTSPACSPRKCSTR